MPTSKAARIKAPRRREIGLVELPAETLLAVVVDGRRQGRLSCSPWAQRELALGWMFSQGLINAAADVAALRLTGGQARARLRPAAASRLARPLPDRFIACSGNEAPEIPLDGLPRRSRRFAFTLKQVAAIMDRLPAQARMFRRHGGIHCAMLADMKENAILVSREDIGRSNCVDKVIGWGLARRLRFERCALFTTGRVSAEMALKCLRAGIPALVSQTTLTGMALAIARASGLTVVGHVLKPRPIQINF